MRSRVSSVAAALALAACSGGAGRVAASGTDVYPGYRSTGLASWYGEEAAGARTASGAPFDPAGITAAHRTLPLGSFAEVTAIDTGQSVVVLINDRGPGRRDRLIDLSRGAAQRLGFGNRSTAAVRVRAISPADAAARQAGVRQAAAFRTPVDPTPALDANRRYRIQVASFSDRQRADALADVVGGEVVPSGSVWRVRIGPLNAAAAQRARDAVAARGYGDAQILPAD